MEKRELMKMTGMVAADRIMKKALSDIPKIVKMSGHVKVVFEYEVMMGAEVRGDILLVNFYLTLNLHAGGRAPVYTLFLEKDSDSFLTYDYIGRKWREANLERLDWPNCSYCKKVYADEADRKRIADYLQTEEGSYWDISLYQYEIRERQLKARYKRETDPWDKVMEQVPPLPKDWDRWVARNAVTNHFIFYRYARHVSEGFCSRCGKTVPISEPRHNKMGRCPGCRQKIQYKAVGRAGAICTEEEIAYLLQPFGNGFIIREFTVYHKYTKGSYETPEHCYYEYRRIFVDQNLNGEVYYLGYYKQRYYRWIRYNSEWERRSFWHRWSYDGHVYRRTLPALNRGLLSRTGFSEYLNRSGIVDPEKYLLSLKETPELELLVKAGFIQLTCDVLDGKDITFMKAHSLKKMLGIDKFRMKWLLDKNGGVEYLKWFQEEKRQQKGRIPDHVIEWFVEEKISLGDLSFISDRMSTIQIYNYLRRQIKQSGQISHQLIMTWKDYLSMAEKLNMDTKDPIIYRTSKLIQRHNEAVQLLEQKNFNDQVEELTRKFPKVSDVYAEIREKYEYLEDDTYAVLVPECIRDIMVEGRKLHHCVGSEERYYDRINRQETYILFLRMQNNLQKAFYTLEVEPGGVIRQKRTEYDRQKTDIQDATAFLKKWQQVVALRLSGTDLQLARESGEMRIREYEELRKNGVRIRGGIFSGKLLADVLEADLLEVQESEKAA